MDDTIVGHAVPSPDVKATSPGLENALRRLLALEKVRPRDCAVSFTPSKTTLVEIFDYEAADSRRLLRRWTLELPTMIRGRFVGSLEEWAEMEIRSPIEPDEVANPR